jgi:hypothetical protein
MSGVIMFSCAQDPNSYQEQQRSSLRHEPFSSVNSHGMEHEALAQTQAFLERSFARLSLGLPGDEPHNFFSEVYTFL